MNFSKTLFALSFVSVVFVAACAGTLDRPERFTGTVAPDASAVDLGDSAVSNDAASACPDVPQTVFATNCGGSGCHGPMNPASKLDLLSPNVASRVVGVPALIGGLLVDPAHPEKSQMYVKLTAMASGLRMPTGRVLDDATIACVLSWAKSVATAPKPDLSERMPV